MPTRRRWKPKWSEPCPCASGKKFKDCCQRRLPDFDIGKAYTAAIKGTRLERALLATRADVTQYTIWHKTNTAPALATGGVGLKLLRIDVNALGSYVGRLSSLYFYLGLWKDWPAALKRLRTNIQHPSWSRKRVARMSAAICGDGTIPRMSLRSSGLRSLRKIRTIGS
jgi:SEC-C motif